VRASKNTALFLLTFALDVVECHRCGGLRRVLAYVTGKEANAVLDSVGLASRPPMRTPARGL
jgi:hypothetical protein